VLTKLQKPFEPPCDAAYHYEPLLKMKPSTLFMQLLDYSKTANGEIGRDPHDGHMYVVTEMAQYSLKDYISARHDQHKPISKESIRSITKAILVVMAGLHAKGLVHLDLKPENLMVFGGRLKLIDVDGCVEADTVVSIHDSSISFSPCYCAPEWAKFLIQSEETTIPASPALDVWSVGMTIAELVTLDAILKPGYANFLKTCSSHRQATFLFLEYLSEIKSTPLPKKVKKLDTDLFDMLSTKLLLCSKANRSTLAQCLQHQYVASVKDQDTQIEDGIQKNVRRFRPDDMSSGKPLLQGLLWKLNTNADPKDLGSWLQRDMWLSNTGALCYFSQRDSKRLVLIDGAKLCGAKVTVLTDCVKDHAFQVTTNFEDDEKDRSCFMFACDSEEQLLTWTSKMTRMPKHDMLMTVRLGTDVAEDLHRFKINVRNRRKKIQDTDDKAQFQPIFEGMLWKLKVDGNPKSLEDWFLREMWLTKNGTFMYWSKREEQELVYYNANDVAHAKISKIPVSEAAHQHAFAVELPPSDDIEFAVGQFAAESDAQLTLWMQAFHRFCQD